MMADSVEQTHELDQDGATYSQPGDSTFGCWCGKQFSNVIDLKRHDIRAHTPYYGCLRCGAAFCEKRELKIHMRRHRGEKQYECEQCGKRFSQRCSLKKHVRIHTGEKPYECDRCGKRFSLRCNLKRHNLRIHTHEIPYGCFQLKRFLKMVV